MPTRSGALRSTHRGDRKLVGARIHKSLDVAELAAAQGYSSISDYVADLIYDAADRPDLKIGPSHQEVLALGA